MKTIEYITVRIGLKITVLFENDFIDNDPDKTMSYLYHFLGLLYDDGYYEISYKQHEFI